MTDLTPFFNKCVSIYQEDYLGTPKVPGSPTDQHDSFWPKKKCLKQSKLTLNNTFIQDSTKVYNSLQELENLINEIQKDYLLSDSKEFSEQDKDSIDSNFKIQLSKLDRSLEKLKKYSDSLNKLLDHGNLEDLGKNLLTMGDYGSYVQIVNNSIELIRSNIIKSLGLKLTKISNNFIQMNSKRMERKKQLIKSSLINKDSYQASAFYDRSINTDPANDNPQQGEISNDYNEITKNLPKQQIQELIQENQTLALQLKQEQLESVTKMENTMIDISSMISEIGLQLNLHNDSIQALVNEQDDTMGNISKGNLQLVKANERAKDSGKLLFYLIMVLSFLLLTIDFIL